MKPLFRAVKDLVTSSYTEENKIILLKAITVVHKQKRYLDHIQKLPHWHFISVPQKAK